MLAKDVPFNFVNGTLILFCGGKQFFVGKDDSRLAQIKTLLNDAEAVEDSLLDILAQNAIDSYVKSEDGKAFVKDGEVYFNGEVVNSVLASRIKECMTFGLPFEHMLKFMENISANPSYRSTEEFFDFLSNKSLPITPDGHFLAYKAIRNDWLDKYSGKILNNIGAKPFLPRNRVDDAREHQCSFGLHVGALPYVQSYGSKENGDRIIYVKVNPKDVVSVPKDYNAQKVRVCEYEVVGEYKGELNQSPVYSVNEEDVDCMGCRQCDGWEDEWDDEDFDDDWDYEPTYRDDYEEEDEEYEEEEEDDIEYNKGDFGFSFYTNKF